MEEKQILAWMEGYIKAWNSNDPEDIRHLFTADARYFTAPYQEPWDGREQIVAGWLVRRDEPGEFAFRYEILGLTENRGFVRGWTKYHEPPRDYSNLWIIRLNDQGKCEEFVEWWMKYK